MPIRKVNGNTYQEIAVVAADSIPTITGLSIPEHDKIELSYSGTNLTGVVYKVDSSTVATLTLAYDGSGNLTSVTKS